MAQPDIASKQFADHKAQIVANLGARFNPSTKPLLDADRKRNADIPVRPVDARGNVIFSQKVIAACSVLGTFVVMVLQSGRDLFAWKGANNHLIESELMSAAILWLTGNRRMVRDPATGEMVEDRIRRVIGGGSSWDVAGMVLWTIYNGVTQTLMPRRILDGVSSKGTNYTVTIYGLLCRAGAGPQFADFIVQFESGRWIIVSVKGTWDQPHTVKDGKRVERKPAGAIRITTNGEASIPYFMGGGEVLQLNIKVDHATGEAVMQSCLLGGVIRHQGGVGESKDKQAIYLSPNGTLCYNHSRMDALATTHPHLVSEYLPVTNGRNGIWHPIWADAVVDIRKDVPANFGVSPSSKPSKDGRRPGYTHAATCNGKCSAKTGAGCNGGQATKSTKKAKAE